MCQSWPTQKSPRAGTSGFRAPEVLLKHPDQTTAVDVWSAGVVLLCLLSGKYPFFKACDDLSAMMQLVTLLGSKKCEQAAKHLEKVFCSSPSHPAQSLISVCQYLRSMMLPAPICPGTSDNAFTTHSDSKELLAYDLQQKCLELTPSLRITAGQALNHPFLKDVV